MKCKVCGSTEFSFVAQAFVSVKDFELTDKGEVILKDNLNFQPEKTRPILNRTIIHCGNCNTKYKYSSKEKKFI